MAVIYLFWSAALDSLSSLKTTLLALCYEILMARLNGQNKRQ